MTAPSPPAAASPTPWRSIAFLSCAAFVAAATMRAPDSLLPEIARDLGTTPGEAAAMVTAFTVSYGLLQIFYGPVGDRLGKYAVIAAMTALSALGAAACALSASMEQLALARFFQGATAAAIIPLAMAWVGDAVPFERRQPVLARFLTGQILGLVFGQAAAGALGEHLGWRPVFWTLAALYLLAGAALLVELRTGAPGRAIPTAAPSTLAGSLRQIAEVARRPWPRVVLVAVFLEGLAFWGAFAFVGTHLHDRFGLGLDAVGLMLCAMGAGGLLYAWLAPRLVARLGQRGLTLGGGALLGAAFVVLGLSPVAWTAPLGVFGCGLGFYMLHNTLQTHGTQMAPEARGAGVALFALVLFLGQSIGVAIAGATFDRLGAPPTMLASAVALPAIALWFAARLRRHGA